MTEKRNDFDENAYNPTFEWGFLAPKYWGTWIIVILGLPLALLPHRIKFKLASKIAKKLIQKPSRTINNAWVNLTLCFPKLSQQERQELLENTLITAGCFLLTFPLLSLRGQKWLQNNTTVRGMEHIQTTLNNV